jgi:hypothetical protein
MPGLKGRCLVLACSSPTRIIADPAIFPAPRIVNARHSQYHHGATIMEEL